MNNYYLTDKKLIEIDYGKAEGLNVRQVKKKFPKLINSWNNEKDVKFPEGESYSQVNNRMNSFLRGLKKKKWDNLCIITHNVVLRCLIGGSFNLPIKLWHKIKIPYLMSLEFLLINNRIIPNIERKKLKKIFSNLIL